MNQFTSHYDSAYYMWQREIGAISANVELFKFNKYVNKNDIVLDFGCGGGFILNALHCKRKIGIEINEIAAHSAKGFGIDVYSDLSEIPSESIDCVISHHALEHCGDPSMIVRETLRVMKPGAKAIFVVPSEHNRKYIEADINQHIFTWSPNNLGNLFKVSGFDIIEVFNRKYLWFEGLKYVYKYFGRDLFNLFARLHGLIRPSLSEVQIVAVKPTEIKKYL